jgi:hypothetical protein
MISETSDQPFEPILASHNRFFEVLSGQKSFTHTSHGCIVSGLSSGWFASVRTSCAVRRCAAVVERGQADQLQSLPGSKIVVSRRTRAAISLVKYLRIVYPFCR